MVVAESFEEAEYGAELVKVEYAPDKPEILMDNRMDQAFLSKGRGNSKRGDFAAAIASASVQPFETVFSASALMRAFTRSSSAFWLKLRLSFRPFRGVYSPA